MWSLSFCWNLFLSFKIHVWGQYEQNWTGLFLEVLVDLPNTYSICIYRITVNIKSAACFLSDFLFWGQTNYTPFSNLANRWQSFMSIATLIFRLFRVVAFFFLVNSEKYFWHSELLYYSCFGNCGYFCSQNWLSLLITSSLTLNDLFFCKWITKRNRLCC